MKKLSRKEKEQMQKLDAIIDAAVSVFFNKGFDNATMDDVAVQAEYSKGSLYFYFKSKNELCLAIVNRSLNLLRQTFEDILKNESPGITKLAQLVEAFINFRLDYPEYYQSIISFRNHHQNCDNNTDYMIANQQLNKEINDLITNMISTGIQDKSIRPAIHAQMTAYSLWGNLSGLLPGFLLSEETNAEFSSVDLLKYWYKLILMGLTNTELTNS